MRWWLGASVIKINPLRVGEHCVTPLEANVLKGTDRTVSWLHGCVARQRSRTYAQS